MQAALDELRAESGSDRVDLGELVVLGANQKLATLRGGREARSGRIKRLTDGLRAARLELDPDAADEVRRSGWART